MYWNFKPLQTIMAFQINVFIVTILNIRKYYTVKLHAFKKYLPLQIVTIEADYLQIHGIEVLNYWSLQFISIITLTFYSNGKKEKLYQVQQPPDNLKVIHSAIVLQFKHRHSVWGNCPELSCYECFTLYIVSKKVFANKLYCFASCIPLRLFDKVVIIKKRSCVYNVYLLPW